MKIKHLMIGMLAIAASVACDKVEPVEEPVLEVNKTEVAVAATAAEGAFEVTANNAWTATADADWVSLTPAAGDGAEKAVKVKVTADDNTATEARTATVTVKSGALTKIVKVTQAAAEAGEEPGPGDDPTPEVSWGMMGMFVDNQWSTDVPMTQEGEWIVAKGAQFSELTFKIRGNASWDDATNIGVAPGAERGVVNGKIEVVTAEYAKANLGGDAADIKLNGEPGTYDVYFNVENLEVYVMEEGYKPGEAPEAPVDPVTSGVIWENDGTAGASSWEAAVYRFSIEGGDSQNECVAEIPAAVWAGMKIAPFCVEVQYGPEATWWQIRILDGWWSTNDESGANDITPHAAGLVDNGDGTYTFQVDLSANTALLEAMDTKHLLFAGDGFIINKIYFGEAETPAAPVDVDIDGKQWVFTWQALNAPFVIDLGVTEPGVAILAYDMAVLDPEYAGIYYPYMIGTYEITKTDGTSGVVTFTDIDYGETINIPYSNATENSVHFESEALLEENVDCTLATSKIEISMESAEYLPDGEYWIIADGKVATPLTSNYGYLQVTDAIDGKSYAANAFTFTQVEEGLYTIQDASGKYYYQTGTYNSFNVSATDGGTDEYLWEVFDTGNGTYAIINYDKGKYIQLDSQYGTYGSYSEEKGTMPALVLAEDPIAEPEQPGEGETGEYATTVVCNTVSSAYVDGVATVNGVADVFTLKLGTSKLNGTATVTLPAGATEVSFYAVGWKNTSVTLQFSVGGEVVATQAIAANVGATGNSPYTMTVTDSDKYTLSLGEALAADTEVTVETTGSAYRAILFGIQAK